MVMLDKNHFFLMVLLNIIFLIIKLLMIKKLLNLLEILKLWNLFKINKKALKEMLVIVVKNYLVDKNKELILQDV